MMGGVVVAEAVGEGVVSRERGRERKKIVGNRYSKGGRTTHQNR